MTEAAKGLFVAVARDRSSRSSFPPSRGQAVKKVIG